MTKVFVPRSKKEMSVFGKRKLDLDYSRFIAESTRSPLASPKLQEKIGVTQNGDKK